MSSPSSTSSALLTALYFVGLSQLLLWILREAYRIRLYAIQEYGRVIHEFDPYFNYRATEYLYEHGWKQFVQWFDYMVWYPLGRPVGTTIYPGMQVVSVFIKNYLLPDWSINDICCFVPAWFGATATLFTGLLAYECNRGDEAFGCVLRDVPVVGMLYLKAARPAVRAWRNLVLRVTGSSWGWNHFIMKDDKEDTKARTRHASLECLLFAAAIMSIVPAHLMRSIGGGYDNESVAISAMTSTFYLWVRSLRGSSPTATNIIFAILSGVAYFFMVAAWGGYVFVLNLIGLHASLLVLLGRYSTKLHRSYTLFYLIGTSLAVRVPVVGWTPLKSLEQMGPLLAFGGFQLIEFCEIQKRKHKLTTMQTWKLRLQVFAAAGVLAAALVAWLAPTGYFGPISARVRGLFVEHTKTGNPLVDSVAEHQPASNMAYFQYLHDVCFLAPIGFVLMAMCYFNDSSSFLLVYGAAAYFFSHRMVRLVLLTAPIASALGGTALGHVWAWCLGSVVSQHPVWSDVLQGDDKMENGEPKQQEKETSGQEESKKKKKVDSGDKDKPKISHPDPKWVRLVRFSLSAYLLWFLRPYVLDFYRTCHDMAKNLSHPTIIQKAVRRDNNQEILIDDYREAYWWVRDNTPEDARIMAWWDYGYQITGIANRTTIADGNTWNHEHIALLGRALTSPEKEGHRIARHLADYILTWSGGGGDDLAKSPHLARIANSVYRHMCPGDPTCRGFGFRSDGRPTPKMEASLLYKLNRHGTPGVEVDKNRFRLVYKSQYDKVRVYKILSVSKESKEWVADPANRICDVPGGWFCRGQYPPGLQKILKEKKDFKQLEDFNVKGEDDSEYQRQYMENLKKSKTPYSDEDHSEAAAKKPKRTIRKLSQEEIDKLNSVWEDTEMTSTMWQLIHSGNTLELRDLLMEMPELAHIRSKDGRGPMFWAYEYGQTQIIKLLKKVGASDTVADAGGVTPLDLKKQE